VLRKYFGYVGDLELPGSVGTRKLHEQLRLQDVTRFLEYTARMLYLRNVRRSVPFGPKLSNFAHEVATSGLLQYHVKVWKEAQRLKARFSKLFSGRLEYFELEDLQGKTDAIDRLYDFAEVKVSKRDRASILSRLSEERADRAKSMGPFDREIRALL
jgi:hypothetical protein